MSIYNPYVYNATPQSMNKFPLVIIKQTNDVLYSECLAKEEQKFKIEFEIEIYTMDKQKIANRIITKELIELVNDVFDKHYGFNRKANNPIPNIDMDIDRQYMRYEGIVDENKKIYRR